MSILIALLTGICHTAISQSISSEILTRVLAVRNGTALATGFTLDVAGRQYLVTAKHFVPGTNTTATVEVFRTNAWMKCPVTIRRSEEADIAVLVPPIQLTQSLSLDAGFAGTMLTEEVFFLGFPDMIFTDIPPEMNNGYPLPFVKRGIVSAWKKGKAKYPLIFVDGHNNPGFSGGPLVRRSSNNQMKVVGVVSGYKASHDRVVNNEKDTGLTSLGNAGIVICHNIEYALDEIKKVADGPTIQAAWK